MWRTRDRALERGVEPFGRTVELRENSAPASWPSRPSQGVNELDEGDGSSADRVKRCTRLRSDLKSAEVTAASYARRTVDLPALFGPTKQTMLSNNTSIPSGPTQPKFAILMRTSFDVLTEPPIW